MIINHDIYQEPHLFASGLWHHNSNSPLEVIEKNLYEDETEDNYTQNIHKYENLHHITAQVVKVVENKVPEKVLCTAEAYPEASFMWRFNDEIIQTQVGQWFWCWL